MVTDIRMPRMNGLQLFERDQGARPRPAGASLSPAMATSSSPWRRSRTAPTTSSPSPSTASGWPTAVARAAEKRRLVLENRRAARRRRRGAGRPAADRRQRPPSGGCARPLRQVADADVDVLVHGETGSGKEVVASLLHQWSRRRAKSLRRAQLRRAAGDRASRASCSATRPAPSPARERKRIGRIEHAERRHAVPRRDRDPCRPALQVKLLRVLETREVDAARHQRAAARSTCGSSPPPRSTSATPAQRGGFREDLYYRLNVVTLRIPPLRERRGDIPAALRALPRAGRRPLRPTGAGRSRGGAAIICVARLAGQRARARRISPTASRSASARGPTPPHVCRRA